MNPLRWTLLVLAVVALACALVSHHYVLSSKDLNESIRKELPPGSSRAEVISFIEARHPVARQDTVARIKTRLSGRAENLIYRKDVVLTFDFDDQGRLSSYSINETLTFF